MNLVGKIFTVLIFVMGILFMGFAVAVYATHKNWKEVVTNTQVGRGKELGLAPRLERTKKRNEELKDLKAKLDADLAKEKKAREQVTGKLEEEYNLLERKHNTLEQERLKLVEAERKAVVTMDAIQKTLKALRDEIGGPDGKSGLRGDIVMAQQEKDAAFKEVVRLTDELHQAVNELKRLRAREVALAEDLARAEKVLRHFGLTRETDISGVPPIVKGEVQAVTGGGLVEISIGSDDGLQKGHRLHVYRVGGTPPFVGDVLVLETWPDKAVCRIDPTMLKSRMQEGDRVASKLQ